MAAERRPHVFIVDDSAVMRSLLRSLIASDSDLEVAGTAVDGATALAALPHTHPDLIVLDVEMPAMDGLATLRELRRCGHKMPVIMCSSLTQRGAQVTLDALAAGASDYVTKPAGQTDREAALRALGHELLPRIHALTRPASRPSRLAEQRRPSTPRVTQISLPPINGAVSNGGVLLRPPLVTASPSVVAIGVSTGGPAALEVLLPKLPAGFPLPVLIVQHMPELFTHLFAERLNDHCSLPVHEANDGEIVNPGTIYIARGNWHLEAAIAAAAANVPASAPMPVSLRLSQGPLENHCRPAVDVLFRSVARVYGAGAVAVVLTGMGSDGLQGCRAIRERGGSVLAQDEASSTVWGMPGAVAGAGLAHRVLSLGTIAPEIVRLAAMPPASSASINRPEVR